MDPKKNKKLSNTALLILLLGGSLFLGSLTLAVIGGVIWWKRDDLRDVTQESFAKADHFAVGHTQEDCADEAFREFARCPGLGCELRISIFVRRCITKATPSPGYCADMPHPMNSVSMAAWALKECNRRGFYGANQSCTRVAMQVPQACHAATQDRERRRGETN